MAESVRPVSARFHNVLTIALKYILCIAIFGLVLHTMIILYSKEVECHDQNQRSKYQAFNRPFLAERSAADFDAGGGGAHVIGNEDNMMKGRKRNGRGPDSDSRSGSGTAAVVAESHLRKEVLDKITGQTEKHGAKTLLTVQSDEASYDKVVKRRESQGVDENWEGNNLLELTENEDEMAVVMVTASQFARNSHKINQLDIVESSGSSTVDSAEFRKLKKVDEEDVFTGSQIDVPVNQNSSGVVETETESLSGGAPFGRINQLSKHVQFIEHVEPSTASTTTTNDKKDSPNIERTPMDSKLAKQNQLDASDAVEQHNSQAALLNNIRKQVYPDAYKHSVVLARSNKRMPYFPTTTPMPYDPSDDSTSVGKVLGREYDSTNPISLYTGSKVPKRVEPEELDEFHQTDPRLVVYVRTYHIYPPSTLPYNFPPDQQHGGVGNEIRQKKSKPNGGSIDTSSGKVNAEENLSSVSIVKIVQDVLNLTSHGFFVDTGLNYRDTDSVTLLLEKMYNWTGLLIEGSPVHFPILRSFHRKAWISDVMLSPLLKPLLISVPLDTDDTSIKSEQWNLLGIPLYTLISALEVSKVDFLNLNVNGWEVDVLHYLPFDQIFIQVISVNISKLDASKIEALQTLMAKRDYVLLAETRHSKECNIFVHKN